MHLLTATLYLREIRRIAALPDEQALAQVDGLLKLLESSQSPPIQAATSDAGEDDDAEFEREQALEELAELEREIAKAERELDKEVTSDVTAENLRCTAAGLEEYRDSEDLKAALGDRVVQLRAKAEEIAEKLDGAYLLYRLGSWLESEIKSQVGAYSMIEELDRIHKELEQRRMLTPDLAKSVRDGKERAAWFRARKKLDDAEIAEAAGKRIRAPRMRDEARALLKQDWKHAFPKEKPPDISS